MNNNFSFKGLILSVLQEGLAIRLTQVYKTHIVIVVMKITDSE